jgi:hypothetical protein
VSVVVAVAEAVCVAEGVADAVGEAVIVPVLVSLGVSVIVGVRFASGPLSMTGRSSRSITQCTMLAATQAKPSS